MGAQDLHLSNEGDNLVQVQVPRKRHFFGKEAEVVHVRASEVSTGGPRKTAAALAAAAPTTAWGAAYAPTLPILDSPPTTFGGHEHGGDGGKDMSSDDEGEGLSWEKEAYMGAVLGDYTAMCEESKEHHLGYPINMDYDFGALHQLQRFSIINAGDPFVEGNVRLHSRAFEVGVLDWFARLWEMDASQYWGYVTSGGTEGNHHGILNARELFPDGVLYTSKDAHYSVFKAAWMFRIECVTVESTTQGEMDYDDLERNLIERKDRPAIVVANIGTTMKGAVDNVDTIISLLHSNGFSRDRFYIHCDGALFGLMLPFAGKNAMKLSFKKEIDSISISGHKFLGCPLICGVQMMRRSHVERSRNVEYIASKDTTITGCRSGHAPIYLWFGLNKKGYQGIAKDVEQCLRNARWLHARLRSVGIGAMLNPLSTTVLFERPQEKILLRRWQIACQGKTAHIVVMPNTTREALEVFVEELIESRNRCEGARDASGALVAPCIADEIGEASCACRDCTRAQRAIANVSRTKSQLGGIMNSDTKTQLKVGAMCTTKAHVAMMATA